MTTYRNTWTRCLWRGVRRAGIAPWAIMGLVLSPVIVWGQSNRATWDGVAAIGTSAPTTAVSQHSSPGIGGLLGAEVWDAAGTAGLRVEGLGEAFTTGRYVHDCNMSGCDGSPMVTAGLLDVVFRGGDSLSARRSRVGYLVGGVGVAHTTGLLFGINPGGSGGYSTASASGFAWNVGLGVRFPAGSRAWFLEAGYLNVPGPNQRGAIWPLSVGIEF